MSFHLYTQDLPGYEEEISENGNYDATAIQDLEISERALDDALANRRASKVLEE